MRATGALRKQSFEAPSRERILYPRSQWATETKQNDSVITNNIMFDTRVCRGNTYATPVITKDQLRNRTIYERNRSQRLAEKKAQRRQMASRTGTPPPVEGRVHIEIQTDDFYEELTPIVLNSTAETEVDQGSEDWCLKIKHPPAAVVAEEGTQMEKKELENINTNCCSSLDGFLYSEELGNHWAVPEFGIKLCYSESDNSFKTNQKFETCIIENTEVQPQKENVAANETQQLQKDRHEETSIDDATELHSVSTELQKTFVLTDELLGSADENSSAVVETEKVNTPNGKPLDITDKFNNSNEIIEHDEVIRGQEQSAVVNIFSVKSPKSEEKALDNLVHLKTKQQDDVDYFDSERQQPLSDLSQSNGSVLLMEIAPCNGLKPTIGEVTCDRVEIRLSTEREVSVDWNSQWKADNFLDEEARGLSTETTDQKEEHCGVLHMDKPNARESSFNFKGNCIVEPSQLSGKQNQRSELVTTSDKPTSTLEEYMNTAQQFGLEEENCVAPADGTGITKETPTEPIESAERSTKSVISDDSERVFSFSSLEAREPSGTHCEDRYGLQPKLAEKGAVDVTQSYDKEQSKSNNKTCDSFEDSGLKSSSMALFNERNLIPIESNLAMQYDPKEQGVANFLAKIILDDVKSAAIERMRASGYDSGPE